MSRDDPMRQEEQAQRRIEYAIKVIGENAGWIWHWGDGEGGHVLQLLRDEIVRRGFRWPYDPRAAYRKAKAKISRSLSREVMERDAYRCVKCGTHINLSCDHIIPESKGGPTTLENLQTMCKPCNSRKGARES